MGLVPLFCFIGFSVPAFGILISLVVELILVQCTNCSETFRSEFSKAGGLRCLQFQLHKASDNEFNKVLTKIDKWVGSKKLGIKPKTLGLSCF